MQYINLTLFVIAMNILIEVFFDTFYRDVRFLFAVGSR